MSIHPLKHTFWLFLFMLIVGCGSKQEQLKAELKDVTESVYASVTIRPQESYFPFASRPGIIQKVFVNEGDSVEAGDLLFQVDLANAENRLRDAKLSLKQAKSNYLDDDNLLKNIDLELQIQKEQVKLDSLNFARQKRLRAQNVGTENDFDQMQLKYEGSRNRYISLQQKYDQTAKELQTAYEKAQNMVANEQTTVQDYEVRAKLSGKVYSVFKETGELILQQEPFAEIGSRDQFIIKMDVDEVDIARIQLKDQVLVSLDAYPDEVFEAYVSKIYPKKDEQTQTFLVESSFQHPPKTLYNGLGGEANIIIARRKNAIIIPADYLLSENEVLTKNGAKSVETGVKNINYVEILAGIDTSTILLKPE